MIRKIILLAVAGIFTCTAASSQSKTKHEVSFWGAGGLSTLKYDTEAGSNKNGFGGAVGVGYNYLLTDRWSLGTGAELSFYNAKTEIGSLSDSYKANDGEADFEFRTAISNYEEKQNTMFINIPVVVQYQLPVMSENKFYVSGGFKFGIPASKKFKVVNADLKNVGYYAHLENPIDGPRFMGFGSFNQKDIKDDLDLKVAYMLSFETGMKWNLSESLSLYTGAYFDYGLNDISKNNDKRLIGYNKENPEEFIHNSTLSSQYTADGETTVLVDKIKPVAIGIKVRLAFGL